MKLGMTSSPVRWYTSSQWARLNCDGNVRPSQSDATSAPSSGTDGPSSFDEFGSPSTLPWMNCSARQLSKYEMSPFFQPGALYASMFPDSRAVRSP